jgi:hypothetical protein
LRFSLLGTIGNGGRVAGSSGAIFPSDKIGEGKSKKHMVDNHLIKLPSSNGFIYWDKTSFKIIQDVMIAVRFTYLALDLRQSCSGPHQVFLHGYLSEANANHKVLCKL